MNSKCKFDNIDNIEEKNFSYFKLLAIEKLNFALDELETQFQISNKSTNVNLLSGLAILKINLCRQLTTQNTNYMDVLEDIICWSNELIIYIHKTVDKCIVKLLKKFECIYKNLIDKLANLDYVKTTLHLAIASMYLSVNNIDSYGKINNCNTSFFNPIFILNECSNPKTFSICDLNSSINDFIESLKKQDEKDQNKKITIKHHFLEIEDSLLHIKKFITKSIVLSDASNMEKFAALSSFFEERNINFAYELIPGQKDINDFFKLTSYYDKYLNFHDSLDIYNLKSSVNIAKLKNLANDIKISNIGINFI